MTDPASRSDELAKRMCRESDGVSGPMAGLVHLLIVGLVGAGAVWTMFGIRDLGRFSERCESELLEFRALTERAARAPRRDGSKVAAQLQNRIEEQVWHGSLDGVRPRVLQTPTGVRVRFARTVPSLEDRQR